MIAEATVAQIEPDNSPETRAAIVGGSEAAAACGVCPYKSRLTLWGQKLGLIAPENETDAMLLGKLMEPVVLALFTRKTGLRVRNQQQRLYHADLPCMAATIDGEIDDESLVEAKTAGWRMSGDWGDEGTDAIPDNYVFQCSHQLAVSGKRRVYVPVLIGGQLPLRIYVVERNDRLIDRVIIPREVEFRAMVESREMPPADWAHPATPETIKALYRPLDGERVYLTSEQESLVEAYRLARDSEKEAERAKREYQARIIAALGAASDGVLRDGSVVKRRMVAVREHTVKAHEQDRLYVPKAKAAAEQTAMPEPARHITVNEFAALARESYADADRMEFVE